ncbi:hypothetical protein [Solimonas soli]|uniref:hypothetical protein n=1 Tax=Solimonas soli TaxID=413479 RepID=UPI000487B110|nr:hypothetical protein [Solimonas soli]
MTLEPHQSATPRGWPNEEILRRAAQDLQALAGWLGAPPYFTGDAPIDTPLKKLVAAHPRLVAYRARMHARCSGSDRQTP